MQFPFFIARRYLFSKKKQNVINLISFISMFGIGVGAMALIIVLSAFNGINSLVADLYSSFDAEIRIEAAKGKTFTPSVDFESKLRTVPQVQEINKSLEETVFLKYKDSQSFATIKGVDSVFIAMSGIDSMIWAGEGRLKTPLGKQQLLVGFMVAEKLGLFIQSAFNPIMVYAAKPGVKTVTAENAFYIEPISPGGIFAINQDIDAKYVVAPYAFVANLLQKSGHVTAYEISLKPHSNPSQVKAQLEQLLGPKYTIKTRYQQNELLYKTNNTEKWATFLILSFILLIATFNIIGSLTILILDKKRDVFVLRGMGATPQTIRAIFFTEGLLISLTGGGVGLILGIIVVLLQSVYGFIPVDGLLVSSYPVALNWLDVLSITALVFIMGSLAALIPSRIILKRM